MNSLLDPDFIKQFNKLPARVRKLARANYVLWKQNPSHPSLDFKRIHRLPIYSVRVGMHYRAVGVKKGEQTMLWFFIGSHAEYDRLVRRL